MDGAGDSLGFRLPDNTTDLLRTAVLLAEQHYTQNEIIRWLITVCHKYDLRLRHDSIDDAADAPPPAVPCPGGVEVGGSGAPEPDASADGTLPTAAGVPLPAQPGPRANGGAAGSTGVAPVKDPIVRTRDGKHLLVLSYLFDNPDIEQGLPARDNSVRRVIISAGEHRRARRDRKLLWYECGGGVVIDAVAWKVLAVPPRAFNYYPDMHRVSGYLGDDLYDVVKVEDGTHVTLYPWGEPNGWEISTANGYAVSSLRWSGPLTYAEIIHDLVSRLYPEFVEASGMSLRVRPGRTTLEFTKLDRSRCYTIGFRHHDFHPVRADPERIWQIQWASLTDTVPRVVFGCGFPRVGGKDCIPMQTVIGSEGVSIDEIYQRGHNSYERAIAFISRTSAHGTAEASGGTLGETAGGGHPPASARDPACELNYGVVLRSHDPSVTTNCSDVLIETDLLRHVRVLYERPPRGLRGSVTHTHRAAYAAIKAYLACHSVQLGRNYLALCPHHDVYHKRCEAVVNKLVDMVDIVVSGKKKNSAFTDERLARVARTFAGKITKDVSSLETSVRRQIIRSHLMLPGYACIYLLLIT